MADRKYVITKFHNAVGHVWWSTEGCWTKDPDYFKKFTWEEVKKQFDEFCDLNDGKGLDCLALRPENKAEEEWLREETKKRELRDSI